MKTQSLSPEVRAAVRRWLIQATFGTVGYGVIIFASAGTLGWIWGWVLYTVLITVMIAHPLILLPLNPELLAERQKGMYDSDVKAWDKLITSTLGGMMVLTWIAAGVQLRLGYSPQQPLILHLIGLAAHILGYGLFMWAMALNAFFSEGVRIQKERGHFVVSAGPYRLIRHPGYLGASVANLATPLLLGSTWAWIPALLLAGLFALRTYLEDRTLIVELPGYQEYAQQTRYRLIPGVW